MTEKENKKPVKRRKTKINKNKKSLGGLIVIISLLIVFTFINSNGSNEINYNEFINKMEAGEIEEVYINFNAEKFKFEDTEGVTYETHNPKTDDFKELLLKNDVNVKINKTSKYLGIAGSIFQFILFIGLFAVLIGKMGIASIVEKKNSLVATTPDVKFDNIAGNEEAKEDMQFLVNFLKNPKKYNKIGAKLPKGVALYGPPGTGKTLTAKAIAGEAGVPFFLMNGSDFIEMYAGMGAKRVRDLYSDAKLMAPCIVFIDEIDAIGTSRGKGYNSGERDQTINALLAELDGFKTSEPVITIIATNRIEDLDKALIRPGRFDKHIAINLPDKDDRLKILKVHSENKKLADDVNLEEFANLTIGFSGAALEALMNESAILAVNNNAEVIGEEHIDEAYYKMIVGGHKKKNKNKDMEELKLIAYHEAGHALVTKLLTDNSVPKVTIIPSTTGMGGATLNIPKRTNLMTKRDILNSIKILYAGRVAELILRKDENEITTGASQDIQQATAYIKNYFSAYGMSEEFGMLEIDDSSKYLKESIELSKKLYNETQSLLQDNQDKLERIAETLIEKETINEEELDNLIRKEG